MDETVAYRPIAANPDYEVGSDGSIWSLKFGKRRKIKPPLNSDGYPFVKLFKDGGGRFHLIHQLVLKAFVGPCPPGLECCHNDGDPSNSRLDNLRWDTKKANKADQVRHGTALFGSRCGSSKLDESEALAIRVLARNGIPRSVLAPVFGVSPTTIVYVVNGRYWRHVPS